MLDTMVSAILAIIILSLALWKLIEVVKQGKYEMAQYLAWRRSYAPTTRIFTPDGVFWSMENTPVPFRAIKNDAVFKDVSPLKMTTRSKSKRKK